MQRPSPGSTLQTQSPWLFLDEAQNIFAFARNRVYAGRISGETRSGVPSALVPVLEEQPKWEILANILDEIEREIYFSPLPEDDSHGTILIMCEEDEDNLLYHQLRDYIQAYDYSEASCNSQKDKSGPTPAHPMLRKRLRKYLLWKQHLPSLRSALQEESRSTVYGGDTQSGQPTSRRGQPPQSKRRRIRGGNNTTAGSNRMVDIQSIDDLDPATITTAMSSLAVAEGDGRYRHNIMSDQFFGIHDHYQLCDPRQLIVVHPYKGDMDDKILEELKPRYVIMYTPDPSFIRRIEASENIPNIVPNWYSNHGQ